MTSGGRQQAGRPRLYQLARAALVLLTLLAGPAMAGVAPRSLQQLVDATPAGGRLALAPGRYDGGVVIRRPIVLDGAGKATIDGGGRGSVIVIRGHDVTLRGLEIVGSGENHDALDSGVQIRGDRNVVEDNIIRDCLFGVDLKQSNHNIVRRNRISTTDQELGLRGDGLRLWYSNDNQLIENVITDVRDVVVWYSARNRIAGNTVSGSRYALHFMYSKYNEVEENDWHGNMVGTFLMYSDGVVIRRNRIRNGRGATAMGIGFKESSDVVVEDNSIVNCAKGIYLDISPYQPGSTNRFVGNRIAYSGVGVLFHSDWQGNVFLDNQFRSNFTQVAVRGGGTASNNVWRGNHWDDYAGFDRDANGRGDTPYRLFAYADRIWLQTPAAAFFRGSPLFEAIDFLDRLAPFSEPTLIVEDELPRFSARGEPY